MADNEQVTGTESVERIRDIIFGPKMRDYEQRFEAVVRDLGRLQQELDQLNEQLTGKDAAQGRNLQALRQELRQASSDQQTALKAEASRLSTQLTEQNAAHNAGTQTLRQELQQAENDLRAALKADADRLSAQLTDQASAQEASQQALRQELRKADAELREELRQIAQRLTDDKPDRTMLGELFIELGNHVKTGGSLADLLQGLDQPN